MYLQSALYSVLAVPYHLARRIPSLPDPLRASRSPTVLLLLIDHRRSCSLRAIALVVPRRTRNPSSQVSRLAGMGHVFCMRKMKMKSGDNSDELYYIMVYLEFILLESGQYIILSFRKICHIGTKIYLTMLVKVLIKGRVYSHRS